MTKEFRALLLGGASVASIALGAAAPAFGQADASASPNADPNTVKEVVVTGIRKALADAIKLKRNDDDLVEAVSAEEIGKLPDESIADSIARLPGLAVQRNLSGRDQDISVRGLPAAMTTALLNGREQATTDNNRAVQFDQYPAELMNSVVVYKSGDAALIGGAIATVDMRTIRPLDYGKFELGVSARGQFDQEGVLTPGKNSTDLGDRFALVYVDQFLDHTLGVTFGFQHQSSPNQIISQHPYGYTKGTDYQPGLQDEVQNDLLMRNSGALTIQYKPNDRLNASLDVFVSRYIDDRVQRGVEFNGLTKPTSAPTSDSNYYSAATYQVINDDFRQSASLKSVGGNVKYDFGDGWSSTVDLNYSSAWRLQSALQLYSGTAIGSGVRQTTPATIVDGSAADDTLFIVNGVNPANLANYALGENRPFVQNYSNNWPGGPQVNAAGAGYSQFLQTYDQIKAVRWNVDKAVEGPLSRFEVGVNFQERKKSLGDHEGADYLTSLNNGQAVRSDLLLSPTSLSMFGLPSMASIDVPAAISSGLYQMVPNLSTLNKPWGVVENTVTGYEKTDVNTQLFGRRLNGNFGIQVIYTDQSVTGLAQSGTKSTGYLFTNYSGGTKYVDVLPTLNLTYHLDNKQAIRFDTGRSIARARLDTMAGTASYGYNAALADVPGQTPWSGSLGNAKLKPWLSDDVNLSYENFFGRSSYVSAALFYKNLETFIYDAHLLHDFHEFEYSGPPPSTWLGYITTYQNGRGGSLYGAELTATFSLGLISRALDGFGIYATGAYTEAALQIPPGGTTPDGRIPQLSKYTANVAFFYEKYGWSARINDRYRSNYDQEVTNYDGSLQPIQGQAENIVDAQVGYSFTTGGLKGLSITLSGQNLTNTPQNSYIGGNPNNPEYFKRFGTNYLFGINYKM